MKAKSIFELGTLTPSTLQVDEAKKYGDASFVVNPRDPAFFTNLPHHNDGTSTWKAEEGTLILLNKLKCVEPHTDAWIGRAARPKGGRRAIFWLLSGRLNIQVAHEWRRIEAGQFVVFNDSHLHSVQAAKIWQGAAWQISL